jgi:hypothetical protein
MNGDYHSSARLAGDAHDLHNAISDLGDVLAKEASNLIVIS